LASQYTFAIVFVPKHQKNIEDKQEKESRVERQKGKEPREKRSKTRREAHEKQKQRGESSLGQPVHLRHHLRPQAPGMLRFPSPYILITLRL